MSYFDIDTSLKYPNVYFEKLDYFKNGKGLAAQVYQDKYNIFTPPFINLSYIEFTYGKYYLILNHYMVYDTICKMANQNKSCGLKLDKIKLDKIELFNNDSMFFTIKNIYEKIILKDKVLSKYTRDDQKWIKIPIDLNKKVIKNMVLKKSILKAGIYFYNHNNNQNDSVIIKMTPYIQKNNFRFKVSAGPFFE